MKTAALFLILPLLAACNVEHNDAAKGDDNVEIKGDGDGKVAFDLPFAKGEVKLPGMTMQGADFDIDGVKLMPGSSLGGFNVNAGKDGSTVNIAFKSPSGVEETRAYFLNQFKRKGVDAVASGDGITGTSKDGDEFAIHLAAAGSGTKGTIEVHDKG
jgi:hypothetical protein